METLSIKPAKLCEAARVALWPAARGDWRYIEQELNEGGAVLWRCEGLKGAVDGWVVSRDEGEEFVIVLGAGRGCSFVINEFLRALKKSHFKTVRTHVLDERLKKLYERKKFQLAEYVMRAEV